MIQKKRAGHFAEPTSTLIKGEPDLKVPANRHIARS